MGPHTGWAVGCALTQYLDCWLSAKRNKEAIIRTDMCRFIQAWACRLHLRRPKNAMADLDTVPTVRDLRSAALWP